MKATISSSVIAMAARWFTPTGARYPSSPGPLSAAAAVGDWLASGPRG
jgi:hypothetical protein